MGRPRKTIKHKAATEAKMASEIVEQIVESDSAEDQIVSEFIEEEKPPEVVVESKKPYLECFFCHNTQTETHSKDDTSFWCIVCGRCNELHWK